MQGCRSSEQQKTDKKNQLFPRPFYSHLTETRAKLMDLFCESQVKHDFLTFPQVPFTSPRSGISFQERVQLSLCLSPVFPCLVKFLFHSFSVFPQLRTFFSTICINDLAELLANSLTRSFRRTPVPQHGLQSIVSCPNLNKLERDLEIVAEVSTVGWLVSGERPANPVNDAQS